VQVPGVTSDSITVALAVATTGPSKLFGDTTVPGVEAVFNKINKEGGIHGRQLKYVVAGNDCSSGSTALESARPLIGKVFAFLATTCPAVNSAITTLIAGTTIPNLSNAVPGPRQGAAPDPAKDGYTFFLTPHTGRQAADIMQWAIDNLSPKPSKIGALVGTDAYGDGALIGVNAFLDARKLTLATPALRIEQSATDAAAQMARFQAAGVDAIVLGTFAAPSQAAMKAAYALDYHPYFLGLQGAGNPNVYKDLPLAAKDKFYGCFVYPWPDGSPGLAAFLKQYQPYTQTELTSYFVLAGVGFANIFADYLRKVGPNLTQERFLEIMYATQLQTEFLGTLHIQRGQETNIVKVQNVIHPDASGLKILGVASTDFPIPGF
jgi:branched-chain amino acid transport system substrate-binding protein